MAVTTHIKMITKYLNYCGYYIISRRRPTIQVFIFSIQALHTQTDTMTMTNNNDGGGDDDKLAEIEDKIKNVLAVTHDNVRIAIDRGESLDILQKRSESLSENALLFHRKSRALRCQMIRKYWMNILLLVTIIVVFSIIIWAIVK